MTYFQGGGATGGSPTAQDRLTGNEVFPFDNPVAAATGQNPTTAVGNINIIGQAISDPTNFRNLFRGGDFSINPFQHAATPTTISGNVTTTPTYQADGFVFWGGTSRQMTCQGVAIAPSTTGVPAQFSRSLQFASTAAQTGVVPVAIGQILETAIATRLQGQQVTLSFWALAGAAFSGANSSIVVSGLAGTGSDQGGGAALTSQFSGGITATAAATSWTNAVSLLPTPAQLLARSVITPVNPSAQSNSNPQPTLWAQSQGAFQNGVAVPISTSWARYSVTFNVPTLQAAAAITEVGFAIGWKTVGTTGVGDNISLAGVQLEIDPAASPFEFISPEAEFIRCARHLIQFNEPANAVLTPVWGQNTTTTAANITYPFPVPMRAIPTTTVASGSFKNTAVAGTPAAATLATTAQGGSLTSSTTMGVAGISSGATTVAGGLTNLVGGGGAGTIAWSCEL